MDVNFYQQAALETAFYPNRGNNLTYPSLGLCGEAGETAEKVKKIIRDCDGVMTDLQRDEIAKELSDCCWYIAALASEIDYSLSDILEINLSKLRSRKERGVLSGSGDNR